MTREECTRVFSVDVPFEERLYEVTNLPEDAYQQAEYHRLPPVQLGGESKRSREEEEETHRDCTQQATKSAFPCLARADGWGEFVSANCPADEEGSGI